jgi:phage gp36-like protein
MSLASPQDLLDRFDARLLGQLVNDTQTPLDPTQFLSSPVAQAALDDATGIVYAALFVAYKYTATQIAGVTAESASLLKRLCCDLAIVMLCQRRGWDYLDKFPMVQLSLEMIQQLRNGERVLDLAANEQAGLAAASLASLAQQRRIGLVTTEWHYFPGPIGCGRYW